MYHPDKDVWVLVLNRYQRDNLLWLLEALGVGVPGIDPFQYANTGDWTGEIAYGLGQFQPEPADPHIGLGSVTKQNPNISHETLKKMVEGWLHQRVKSS